MHRLQPEGRPVARGWFDLRSFPGMVRSALATTRGCHNPGKCATIPSGIAQQISGKALPLGNSGTITFRSGLGCSTQEKMDGVETPVQNKSVSITIERFLSNVQCPTMVWNVEGSHGPDSGLGHFLCGV